jgi:hypothetical protein
MEDIRKKMKNIKLALNPWRKTISLIVLLNICLSSYTVKSQDSNYIMLDKVDKIALISTYLNVEKPSWPMASSIIVNAKINAISPEITILMEDNINSVRRNVVQLMKANFHFEVIYGQGLQQMEGYAEINSLYHFDLDSLFQSGKFPGIVSAKYDLNPFKFDKSDLFFPSLVTYFKDAKNYQSTVAKICDILKISHVAVSYSYFKIYPYENNKYQRSNGDGLSIVTNMYFFNKDGQRIAYDSNESKPIVFLPRHIEDYQQVLNKHFETLKPVLEKIAGNQ